MFENIRLAFQGIWGHKMRSVLTMLGIIIGIAAIITIVSTIKGTNEQIKANLIGAGNNVVTVRLNQGDYPYDLSWNSIPAGVRTITEETRKELEERVIQTGRSLWGSYTQIRSGLTVEDYVAFPYGKDVVNGADTNEATIDDFYSSY